MEFLNAFIVGGFICLIGQILIDKTKLTPARILVLFVILGIILTAAGLYEPIVNFAGAGATVPLTGFGYLLAKGTQEVINKDGPIGIISGGFISSAAGIDAVIVLAYIASLISKPKYKN